MSWTAYRSITPLTEFPPLEVNALVRELFEYDRGRRTRGRRTNNNHALGNNSGASHDGSTNSVLYLFFVQIVPHT